MEPSELLRFNIRMQDTFAGFQLAYHRHLISGLDGLGRRVDVLEMPVLEKILTRPGARAWWEKRKDTYSPEFRMDVEARLQEQEARRA